MKKTIMMAALVAVVCFIGACTKEGVYNPSEKISKVYESSTYKAEYLDGNTWREAYNESSPKTLRETWNWDGKKLMSVNHYDSEGKIEADETINFTYDGKRLTKISGAEAGNYADITYDGSVIDKIQIYTNSVPMATVTFTYDGKKVSQIVYTYASNVDMDKAPKSFALLDFINHTMTPTNNENLTAMIRKDAAKGSNSMTMTYTWDGKNISNETYSNGNYSHSIAYSYDNKSNPYKGFVLGYFEGETVLAASKNNVTKAVSTYSEGSRTETETTEYTYEYDGKWPVSRTYSYGSSDETYRSTGTNVTYFEYVD
ncbi:MAG: hypothetical protein IKS44_02620 [Bacteroidales bacterium]|nr:hypothetical protein [Bacteroidales bacterium]